MKWSRYVNDSLSFYTDIITGFQVMDGEYVILCLEGLAEKGMKLLDNRIQVYFKMLLPQSICIYIYNLFKIETRTKQYNIHSAIKYGYTFSQ